MNEYKIMLGEKLWSVTDYEITQEVHILELLKLRFGEVCLRSLS